MDYLTFKVSDAEFAESTPLRRAFRRHLELFAKALYEIEWADSGDTEVDGPRERAALEAVLGEQAEFEQLILEANEAAARLEEVLREATRRD